MTARTPAPSSITSGTGTSSTPPSTLNSRPIASMISGRTKAAAAEPGATRRNFLGFGLTPPSPGAWFLFRRPGHVHGVRVEPPGISGVGEIVDAIEQPGRFARDQDDRLRGTEAHDFVGGEQRAALEMFADAGGRAARFADAGVGLR